MDIEFLNLTGDEALDPVIKPVKLSTDAKNRPPSYCLPWVEAMKYSVQIKCNEDYLFKKSEKGLKVSILRDGEEIPSEDIFLQLSEEAKFIPKNREEAMERKVAVSRTPSFSSPWQREKGKNITLKMGICWWTPPGWGLFFTSPIHGPPSFRVVEGMVRTDLWHRDVPIIVEPLVEEMKIAKYSVVASAILVPAEDITLRAVSPEEYEEKTQELARQISEKRLYASAYKKKVLSDQKKKK